MYLHRILRLAGESCRGRNVISDLLKCTPKTRNLKFSTIPRPREAKLTPESVFEKIHELSMIKPGRDIKARPPVVTIMGHVDHGKTTLLDSIRKTELVKLEHGGITQHIGAFVVSLDADGASTRPSKTKQRRPEDLVVFLDTPGHKAFSAMRERGSSMTDIVVLVVASDDGVMEQTVESIEFARKASVPIIVAINKIDKIKNDEAKIEYLKAGLKSHDLVLEEDGGSVQSVRMSALQSTGINELKEAILALAETLQLKAPVDGFVEGTVIESSVDPHRGRLATILVQKGTLKRGDIIVAASPSNGTVAWAKVRAMFNEHGQVVSEASPSIPVQVIGWRDDSLPSSGDLVHQLSSEKNVKDIVKIANQLKSEEKNCRELEAIKIKMEEHNKVYQAELSELRARGIRYKRKRLNGPREKLNLREGDEFKTSVVLKADVNGSLEVLLNIFESYPNEAYQAKLDLVHYGLGNVTENDIEMASCFPNGVVFTFNTGVFQPALIKLAKELDVPIKRHSVIYHLVDDLKQIIQQRMPLVDKEHVLGEAVVQQEFIVKEKRAKVPVAGSRCTKGVLQKSNAKYKLIRGGQVIQSGLVVSSMRHHKDEVDSIKTDYECGLRFEALCSDSADDAQLRFLPQDVLVCYKTESIRQPLIWKPKGF